MPRLSADLRAVPVQREEPVPRTRRPGADRQVAADRDIAMKQLDARVLSMNSSQAGGLLGEDAGRPRGRPMWPARCTSTPRRTVRAARGRHTVAPRITSTATAITIAATDGRCAADDHQDHRATVAPHDVPPLVQVGIQGRGRRSGSGQPPQARQERAAELGDRRKPLLGLLGEGPVHRRDDPRRDTRPPVGERDRVFEEDLAQRAAGPPPRSRAWPARQEPVAVAAAEYWSEAGCAPRASVICSGAM